MQIPTPRYKVGRALKVKRILVEAEETRLYGLLVVAATHGLRRGELLGLRWEDLDQATLTVEQTVQRVDGRLLVDETKSEASDGTVPLPKRNRHLDGVRTRAGLPGVRVHDFRHTVVSLLLALRVPPHVVQAFARHADLDITLSIYAHTNLDDMREALDKIEWDI